VCVRERESVCERALERQIALKRVGERALKSVCERA